jgi:Mce-associated membrane protein
MATPPPVPARRRSVVRYSAVALVLAVTAAAVWFVVAWVQARDDWFSANDAWLRATDDLLHVEELSTVGRANIVTFHTLDYRNVDAGLDNWERASTGKLHDEVVSRRAAPPP